MRAIHGLLLFLFMIFLPGLGLRTDADAFGQAAKPNTETGKEKAAILAGIPVWIAGSQIQSAGLNQTRSIYLVIEPSNFTRENLQAIFVDLAAEYDQPADLRVAAFSDREVLGRQTMYLSLLGTVDFPDTPEGREGRRKLLAQYAPPQSGYFRAYYSRSSKGEEVFWYTPSSEESGSIKVVLRSKESETYTGNPNADLGLAARKGDVAKIGELLDKGADVNAEDGRGDTPLIAAIRAGRSDAIAALLGARADVNKPAINGSTPLIEAAYAGLLETAELLLNKGAEVNKRNRSGISALAAAVSHGRVEVAKLLLARGADANASMEDGQTVLMRAVNTNRKDYIEALLSKGADVNAKAGDGKTALMILGCNPTTLQMLINAGADINAKDHRGWTALMYAVDYAQVKKVQILIEKGAEVNIKNHDEETALRVAKKYRGNEEVVQLLRKAGARD